ncbi:MAG: DUF488 domain-containing protein [Burkholderiaceae bacterium]|nr:DUF488 domain-containing protein [Burkholderiaceae bacterium]
MPAIFTLGHSTRPWPEFLALLQAHKVEALWDVRTVPRSRHNPQFNTDTLTQLLPQQGIAYSHVAGLGGFRKTSDDSPNKGWHNASFRGYADYMQTPEFADNLARLIKQGAKQRIALMCAEAVPWRCHRSLIADALIAHGIVAEEIISTERTQPHQLTSFAVINGYTVSYPTDGSEANPLA